MSLGSLLSLQLRLDLGLRCRVSLSVLSLCLGLGLSCRVGRSGCMGCFGLVLHRRPGRCVRIVANSQSCLALPCRRRVVSLLLCEVLIVRRCIVVGSRT